MYPTIMDTKKQQHKNETDNKNKDNDDCAQQNKTKQNGKRQNQQYGIKQN